MVRRINEAFQTEISTVGSSTYSSRSLTKCRTALEAKYKSLIQTNPTLTRQLVSYQANKSHKYYRWFKFKEAFSKDLVSNLLQSLHPIPGHILDPFAGTGTSLFASSEIGWQATGIELLPVGAFAMRARMGADRVDAKQFERAVKRALSSNWLNRKAISQQYHHVRITNGAFPKRTEKQLNAFMEYCSKSIRNADIRALLSFAAYSILEEVSYTRKDGQYLRWDHRSDRIARGKSFDKGAIREFHDALSDKLHLMLLDISSRDENGVKNRVKYLEGSSLELLGTIDSESFEVIFTSPPYCNRYDYTRTYALELVYLGCNDETIRRLRQEMLSCTVENREKRDYLKSVFRQNGRIKSYEAATAAFEKQAALQEVLRALSIEKKEGRLNNSGIVRMIENYFFEMSLVIFECARLMKNGGEFIMVNDNVQYAGQIIPVDLILTDIAVDAGLEPECIWTLGRGKGNSSQQMGTHGRRELRKSVYVWNKP